MDSRYFHFGDCNTFSILTSLLGEAMITYAENYYDLTFDDYVKKALNKIRVKNMHIPPIKEVKVGKLKPLKARINHGRWIVDCPICNSAEYVFEGKHLLLCQNCMNDGTDLFREVTLPANIDKIEAILNKRQAKEYIAGRPNYPNRNWEPGQTLDDLEKENKENGVS